EARFEFHQAKSDGKTVFVLNPDEIYRIIYRAKDKPAKLQASGVHPRWDPSYLPKAEVSAGDASVNTVTGSPEAPWNAGESYTLRPSGLRVVDRSTIELQFPPVA